MQNQLAKSGGRARHICWCRKLSVLVVPASHNRLADEAGHDDRAGLGLGHHDEQSMPSKHQHKPAQLHVASIAMLVVAPQLLNTRKVASKLTTSSCSNAAVGEKVARRRIEPTNPHRRHGRRGRARSTAFAARELSINLSGEGLPPSAKRLEHFCENMTVAGSTDSDPAGNEGPPAPAVPSAVDEMDGELDPSRISRSSALPPSC